MCRNNHTIWRCIQCNFDNILALSTNASKYLAKYVNPLVNCIIDYLRPQEQPKKTYFSYEKWPKINKHSFDIVDLAIVN